MDGTADRRLRRLLGDPELAWLVARARRRLELGQPLDGTVTLASASASQRQAVGRLLGRSPRSGRALSVSLPAVDAVLRDSGVCPEGLAAAVVALGGEVRVRALEAASEAQRWDAAFARLRSAVDEHGSPSLARWIVELPGTGMVKRLAGHPAEALALLGQVADVLDALPAPGEPLGRFAARVVGGAHALDEGRPLATLAFSMVRALSGIERPGPEISMSEVRREAWASVGVLLDELSSVVLCLGLPGDQASVSGRLLDVGADVGEPVVLTLRQLVRDPPRWSASLSGQKVRICENPVVVAAAADRLGRSCPPLVCTRGQPSAAVMVLLRSLAGAGASLAHHGDFEWGGIRIANVLRARLPMSAWRFGTVDYMAAVADSPGPMLKDTPVEATWDPELASAMHRVGRAVEEESVLEVLLQDLLAGSRQWGNRRDDSQRSS